MEDNQKLLLVQQMMQKKGAAIINGTNDEFREDGYTNMLNKFGTKQDNSTAYRYIGEPAEDDMTLLKLYEGNGLFAKIIDRPSEEAVKHGLDIDFGDDTIAEYVDDRLDNLEFEDKFATAEKWARLYGGSIIVMLVDDGRGLEEPLDWNNVRGIEELRVFERSIVQLDYRHLYNYYYRNTLGKGKSFGEPEYYHVSSIYGCFTVHRSRCLVFRNGRLPEQTTNANYRDWGMPEYVKIKRELRECITSHENGGKLLERSAQAIYKMKNLANMLATSDGEDKVIQRLQIIDMARSIINSIAIDTEGEDYTFETLSMAGVKDVLDSTCNMLSAVTNIPQTILFGRSPAGMNSTGESDMENYYNMVENIQKQNMKANTRIVLDLILRQGVIEGSIKKVPKFKTKFAALWSMSESETATVENQRANTEHVKAQTAQAYIDAGVLDPSEIRTSLAKDGTLNIEDVVPDDTLDIPEDTFDLQMPGVQTGASELISITDTEIDEDGIISIVEPETDEDNVISIQDSVNKAWESKDETITIRTDGFRYPAAAVIVINDAGKILCAKRSESGELCGPGGKTEDFDGSNETAACREAFEEFGITPYNLIPLGEYKASSGLFLDSMVYFTDEYTGSPKADGSEMLEEQWLSMEELRKEKLFPPFKASLEMLGNFFKNYLTSVNSTGTITTDNNDGAPLGNQNAAGPHKRQHLNKADKESYSKRIIGQKTSDGIEVTGFTDHAFDRIAQRNISKGKIEEMLGSSRVSPDKKYAERNCYDIKGKRLVLDKNTGTIITIEHRRQNK